MTNSVCSADPFVALLGRRLAFGRPHSSDIAGAGGKCAYTATAAAYVAVQELKLH